MKKQNNLSLILLNLAYVLALIVVVAPLLILGNYNYPTADDWSYGEAIYHVRLDGGNGLDVIKAVWDTVKYNYFHWEGRFSNALLGCFQPGVWGEQYYKITTWLMIGGIVLGEILLARFLIGGGKKEKCLLYLPVVIPALILQLLYVPYPEETFYWYTGSVNYTFMFAMSLVLGVLFLSLAQNKVGTTWKKALMTVAAVLLGILVGGNNFATSLSTLLAFGCLSILFIFTDKSALKRTWFITLTLLVALLACIFAPANAVRVDANFGGETQSAVDAVINSLVRSFTNVLSWTDEKIVLLLILVVPFLWKAVKKSEFSFRFPGIFAVLSFGIYASQCAATMYVDGTTGGGRMGDILYYSYYVWLLGNVWYWIGWICKRYGERIALFGQRADMEPAERLPQGKCIEQAEPPVERKAKEPRRDLRKKCCGVLWIAAAFSLCIVLAMDKTELTIYKAYRNLRQGFAQQYAKEWDGRLEILRDASVEEVVVEPLSVLPEMLLYTDLQYKDGYYWVNEACAEYYRKKSVDLTPQE